MRKLASIREVGEIIPIKGADRIVLAKIDDWKCVVNKESVKKNQKVVYFEIDSALPVDDSRYEFLKERCHKKFMSGSTLLDECIRIKTIRLKGQISQGLAIPLEDFPELKDFSVGADVSEILGVRHYDEISEAIAEINGNNKIAGDAKGSFPDYIVLRTDEERLQNLYSDYSTNHNYVDMAFECTEKADGSSMTFIYAPTKREDDPVFVCSRKWELKETDNNVFWNVAKKFELTERVKNYCTLFYPKGMAIQGELVGPKINGNKDGLTDFDFKVFRIFDIGKNEWMKPQIRREVCDDLGLNHVKVIKDDWKVFQELKNFDEFLEVAKGKTDNGRLREGLVWKSNDGEVSFKVINNDYLL